MNKYDPVQSDMFASFDATPVNTSITPVPTSDIPTLVEYANKIAKRVWPKDHTRKSNLRACQWFSEYKDFGQLTLADIGRRHIYEFVEHLMDTRERFSQNTANKYMAAISAVMREANEKEVGDNPIKLKYAKVRSGRPRFFSHEEEAQLCEYFRAAGHSWMADMVTMSCKTGMRRGEILSLNHPKVKLHECGEWLYLPPEVTKTGEERDVPLNTQARAAYERLLPVIDDVWSHRTFYWFWKKARRDISKNDPDFTFHVCRHTAASRLANDVKMNEFNIADILGHEDTRTTKRYVHSRRSTLLEGVRQL